MENRGPILPERISPRHICAVSAIQNRLGVSVKDVAGMFSSIHCDNVVLKIGLDKADEMPLPAVLYWDECHFVVLYRVRKGRYYIVDPARGKMKVSGRADEGPLA